MGGIFLVAPIIAGCIIWWLCKAAYIVYKKGGDAKWSI